MDYLILSSTFYKEKLIPPHVLAGDNLSFFPMGYIFRKSGAVFMRRTFRGETLYTAVFKQYLKMLIDEGYSIEFFIEGGRTRNGKILHPKPGIMKYLIEAIKEGYGKDLVFVPAAISYNRVLEEGSYSRELRGREKKKETTSQFVKSRKLLKRNYGKVYLSFNDPVSYQEIRSRIGESSGEISDIALQLTRMIGSVVIVTPASLVSCAILSSTGRGFSRELLIRNVHVLYRFMAASGAKLAGDIRSIDSLRDTICSVLADFETDGIISRIGREFYTDSDGSDPDRGEILFVLNEEDRPKLNFYKNTIVHHLLPLSAISLSITASTEGNRVTRESVRRNYIEFMDILGQEFAHLTDIKNFDLFHDTVTDFLVREGVIFLNDGQIGLIQENLVTLHDCAAILHDYIESYYCLLSTVLGMKGGMAKKDLLALTRKNSVKLYHLERKMRRVVSMDNYPNPTTDCSVKRSCDRGHRKKKPSPA
jgi:glycerol-3-phosphate O-acyltransferase